MDCKICGKHFIPKKKANHNVKYCSKKCCQKAFLLKNRKNWNEIRRRSYQKHKEKITLYNRKAYWKNHEQRLKYKENIQRDFEFNWKKGIFCERCKREFLPKQIHFHHLNPLTKKYEFPELKYKNILEIIAEIAKCIPLCIGCHTIIHKNIRKGNPLLV